MLFQPIPVPSIQYQPISVYSSLFMLTYRSQFLLVLAYSCPFQPIPALSSLISPISAHSSYVQLIVLYIKLLNLNDILGQLGLLGVSTLHQIQNPLTLLASCDYDISRRLQKVSHQYTSSTSFHLQDEHT